MAVSNSPFWNSIFIFKKNFLLVYSICLFNFILFYLTNSLFIYLFYKVPLCLSHYLSIYIFIYIFVYLSIYISIYLSINISIYLYREPRKDGVYMSPTRDIIPQDLPTEYEHYAPSDKFQVRSIHIYRKCSGNMSISTDNNQNVSSEYFTFVEVLF